VTVPPEIPVPVVAAACGYTRKRMRNRLRAQGLVTAIGPRSHVVGWIELQERAPNLAERVYSYFAERRA
jgi:hypothetical protein